MKPRSDEQLSWWALYLGIGMLMVLLAVGLGLLGGAMLAGV